MFDEKVEAHKKFNDIMVLSVEERQQRGLVTRAAVCEMCGIGTQTYQRWIKKVPKNGGFDLWQNVSDNKEVIFKALMQGVNEGKYKSIEASLKILGALIEKREDTVKVEFSPAERIRIARELIDGLREEYQRTAGSCPVCGQLQILPIELCLDTEREHDEESEVATLALSSRPN